MSSAFKYTRPRPAAFEEREDAQEVLASLLDEDSDTTWVRFQYRFALNLEHASRRDQVQDSDDVHVARDLKTLSLDEMGNGGIDELCSQLPQNEVAYVVYNNSKGSQVEDELEHHAKVLEGTRWKLWFKLRQKITHKSASDILNAWSCLLEGKAKVIECTRLQTLAQDLSIFLSPEAPTNDPIKLIEFLCETTPKLKHVYKEALDEFYVAGDVEYTLLHACGVVAMHLEQMQADRGVYVCVWMELYRVCVYDISLAYTRTVTGRARQ